MLLSKENLHTLSSEVEQEQTKLDRILSYVCEQKTHYAEYKSPNHSLNGTQSNSSSSSIAVLSSASFKQTTVEEANKSIASEKHNKLLPQTQANAFHLLQKFTSPNLEMNRLTLKPKTRPKLGLFNKGKSSAQATKTVPDLVFSETKFLKRNKAESISNDVSTIPKKKRQHSISKFFKDTSENRSQHTSLVKTKTYTSPVITKSHTPAIKSHTSPVKTKTYASPINTRSYVSLVKSKSLHASNKQVLSIKSSSVSSNRSMERILKECQDAPDVFDCRSQSSFDNNYYSYYTHDSDTEEQRHHQQLPTYSHVKTPTSHVLPEAIVINSSQEGFSLDFDFLDKEREEDNISSSESKNTLLLFYKEHNIMQQEKPSTPHDGLVDWQIESIGSLEDTKGEYDDDILNFWKYQIKRTL